ncbi:glutathione S-transferase family protein [Teredinibacter sp. KSP-S5-2]|uniref:glutathione S-transferase family protein n=1 Tax=Teredinibacter sp. KSP-S5-2 TaxID=3034506 RepID=UPI0029352178|nr:glutathione S-transferase N-terminal domain-containing protein [Teredinibacter sp. KSP-S5-2]WNO08728.1 glutathione S-transferase N-terminal domain-containing protein [Teredinibacter sp. KSP-S5-2]
MQLYYSSASPFARKATILLHLHDMFRETELIIANPLGDPQFRQVNPLAKVPALVDNALTLVDSPLICEYIDDLAVKQGKKGTFHKGEADYYDVQLIHVYADGIMEAAVATMMQRRAPDSEPSIFWEERWHQAISTTIRLLDPDKLDIDDDIHIGSVSVVAALGYLDLRFTNYAWREENPELAEWYNKVQKRDWYIQTQPE